MMGSRMVAVFIGEIREGGGGGCVVGVVGYLQFSSIIFGRFFGFFLNVFTNFKINIIYTYIYVQNLEKVGCWDVPLASLACLV